MNNFKKDDTLKMRLLCTVLFLSFTFVYLYFYQADILAVAQHVISNGTTHYNRTIGAVIITVTLWLIQLAIFSYSQLRRRTYVLTFVPSLLLLGILTDVSPQIDHESYLGNWLWLFPLLMACYAGVLWVVRHFEPVETTVNSVGLFSRTVWINLLQLQLLFFMVCCIGCNDKVFHYRMRVENDMISRNYRHATQVGADALATDSSLTMLRIWALSEQNQLGERLFEYPLTGGSDAMLPNGRTVKLMMAPEAKLYKHLGVVFRQKMSPMKYLLKLHERHYATRAAHDWLLCAYLLDGNIDGFARNIKRFYNIADSLPKHYREALILYRHLHEHPLFLYRSSVMDADYDDYMDIIHKSHTMAERRYQLRQNYGKTYWFYYFELLHNRDRTSR